MNNKWAVFDMDDVLTNFAESSRESLVKIGYPNIPVSDWKDYSIDKTYGISSHDEFKRLMITEKILENSRVHDGVHEMLETFKSAGASIGILTARGWHPQAHEITSNYIKKHKLPIDLLVIAGNHTRSKISFIEPFLENNGQILSYIDDSPQHIRDFKNIGVDAHLMRRSWIKDEDIKDIPQITSFADFTAKVISNFETPKNFKSFKPR